MPMDKGKKKRGLKKQNPFPVTKKIQKAVAKVKRGGKKKPPLRGITATRRP